MRGGYQPAGFPGNLDGAVVRELERLEAPPARLPLGLTHRRRFSRLLHMPTLELDRIVRCVEYDPLLAISVLRLIATELADLDPVRISDCIIIAGRERLVALAETQNCAITSLPSIEKFAEHARSFSLIASRLAASTGAVDPAAARLAGLLHFLGELPVLLSGCSLDDYSPAAIAGWGERLATSWHLPAAFISAIAAYDVCACGSTPDAMQSVIVAARGLADWPDETAPAAVLLSEGENEATRWQTV